MTLEQFQIEYSARAYFDRHGNNGDPVQELSDDACIIIRVYEFLSVLIYNAGTIDLLLTTTADPCA